MGRFAQLLSGSVIGTLTAGAGVSLGPFNVIGGSLTFLGSVVILGALLLVAG